MKKWLLLPFIFISLTAFAQGRGSVELGFSVGGGLSNITGNQNDFDNFVERRFDPVFSYNVSGQAEYFFDEEVGLKVGLNFERKGYGDELFDDGIRGSDFLADVNLDYVTIPLAVSYHFGNDLNWYVDLGFYYGMLVNAEDTERGSDLDPFFKSDDFGITLGIGYRHQIADNAKLFVGYSGQGGLLDIFNPDRGENIQINRHSLQLGLVFIL